MAALFEALMLVCFGVSWPVNALKSYRARTAVGTSALFLSLITIGYLFGIAAKFIGDNINWVLIVYVINVLVILVNWIIYFRNCRLDKQKTK